VQELMRLGVSGFFSNEVSPERPLTSWELQILKLVADGLQNDEIARQLATSKSTLKRNLQTILAKLKVSNRVGAAAYAAKAGLI